MVQVTKQKGRDSGRGLQQGTFLLGSLPTAGRNRRRLLT
jgi:hypothetical protein